jgi:hypothetical protein
MDPNQQQQHTGMPDDHNMVGGAAPYNFYAGGEADHNGFGVYNPMEGYAGGMVPPGMPPRGFLLPFSCLVFASPSTTNV